MNGQNLDLGCDKKQCLVTIDSGTSHLAMPTWAYEKSKGVIPLRDQGVPCSGSDQFGTLTYVIGGKDYTIPNNEWTFEPESSKKEYKETNHQSVNLQTDSFAQRSHKDDKKCRGAIRERQIKNDMFVIGNIFMHNYYSVFDRDNDRVGLAKRIELKPPSQPPN